MNEPLQSRYIRPASLDDELEELVLAPDDPEIDDPALDREFEEVDPNELALNYLDRSKAGLRGLSKAWKRLNRYPTAVSRTDLREYLEDMQKVNLVHGIKLPVI